MNSGVESRSVAGAQAVEDSPSAPDRAQGADEYLPEQSLPHAFAVVASRVSATLHAMYSARFGLTVVGWRIIAILSHHAPLSAKELAGLTALDPVNVSRALEQLVTKRLVSRKVDPADRRRVVLRLTRKGEEVYAEIVPVMRAAENAVTATLQGDERATLRRLMLQVLAHSAAALPEDADWRAILARHGEQRRDAAEAES